MKKILALVLAMIMAFSLAAPAYAAVPEVDADQISGAIGDVSEDASAAIDSANGVCESLKAGAYDEALKGAFDFAIDLFEAIHSLVHALSEIFDFDCPFCDEVKEDSDKVEVPEVLYDSASAVIGAEFANKDMVFDLDYPQNVDAAFAFTAPTKSIVIDGVATANVNTLIVLGEGATTGKLVFKSTETFNYFHAVEGFKILENYSGSPVAIVLAGDVYLSDDTVITAANIGDYIVGPYTVSVAA